MRIAIFEGIDLIGKDTLVEQIKQTFQRAMVPTTIHFYNKPHKANRQQLLEWSVHEMIQWGDMTDKSVRLYNRFPIPSDLVYRGMDPTLFQNFDTDMAGLHAKIVYVYPDNVNAYLMRVMPNLKAGEDFNPHMPGEAQRILIEYRKIIQITKLPVLLVPNNSDTFDAIKGQFHGDVVGAICNFIQDTVILNVLNFIEGPKQSTVYPTTIVGETPERITPIHTPHN